MTRKNIKKILLIAGEGGHLEQARRFYKKVNSNTEVDYLVITDDEKQNIQFECDVIRMKSISHLSKGKGLIDRTIFLLFFLPFCLKVLLLFLKLRPNGMVIFGPLFCIPFAILGRLFRVKIVLIETWSKFYQPTKTLSFCTRFADRVYIQNKTLKEKVPKGIYSGRL